MPVMLTSAGGVLAGPAIQRNARSGTISFTQIGRTASNVGQSFKTLFFPQLHSWRLIALTAGATLSEAAGPTWVGTAQEESRVLVCSYQANEVSQRVPQER